MMIESEQTEITINGISAGIEHILNFIYTAKLELTLRNVQEILSAANYFQLSTVVDACLNYLEGEIDIENCIDILIISENYSLDALRDKILKFICAHIQEISKSSEFFRLQEHQVNELLSSDLPVDCSEVEMLQIVMTWVIQCDNRRNCAEILSNLNFADMPVIEVEKVLKTLDIKRSDDLYNAVWSRVVPKKNLQLQSDHKLLNRRGLEMAIIKVGGFELTGITNEITFSFLSNENSASIDEPWRYLTEIPHLKQGAYGIAVLNNCIYVIGGSYDISLDNEDVHPFGFKFNPLTSEWTTIKPMNFDRCRFSLNVLEDSLIAVGGHSESIVQRLEQAGNVASVEKYNPETDEWTMLASMPQYRSQHAGVTYKNKLYISGGIDQYGNVLDTFYEYDSTTDVWTKLCHLTPRADHVMLRLGTKIYFCGGWEEVDGHQRLISSIDCFDIVNSVVSVVTHIHTPRYHAGITLMGNKIFIIGGFAADGEIEVQGLLEIVLKIYSRRHFPTHCHQNRSIRHRRVQVVLP